MSDRAFIEAEKATTSIRIQCANQCCCARLGVSTSAFHAWRHRQANPTAKMLADAELTAAIVTTTRSRVVSTARRGCMQNWSSRSAVRLNVKRVTRLMRMAGVQDISRRSRQGCTPSAGGAVRRMTSRTASSAPTIPTDSGSATSPAPDRRGLVYLATVIDAWFRRVVGWSIADHLRAELVIEALDMATMHRRPAGTVTHRATRPGAGVDRTPVSPARVAQWRLHTLAVTAA